MKKLMTALAICVVATAAFADVVSDNIVGYKKESRTVGVWTQPIQFSKIGGEETLLTDILDGSTVEPYSDVLEIYDPALGFIGHLWTGSEWINAQTDAATNFVCNLGNSFLVTCATEWTFLGEVSTNAYIHQLDVSGVTFLGNAFPADCTVASFDWSSMGEYSDVLELYDAAEGFIGHLWTGTEWINAQTDDPLPMDTPLNDGFLLTTTQTQLTQTL